jgi:predicted RNase H-like nuclease (RuvC/YqgF family)
MSILKIERLEKKIKKLEAKLELNEQIKEMELSLLNNHWATKFDMIVGMFEIQAKEAGTISELRKWFKEWTEDINSLNADDCGEQMADIIEKHGFVYDVKPVNISHREILEDYR